MARHLGRGLEHVTLEPDEYAIDLAIADRYQNFSGEVLRLALLGLAGFGYLFGGGLGDVSPLSRTAVGSPLVSAGLLAFGISAASALAHRYYSTDCLTHQVRRIRIGKKLHSLEAKSAPEQTDLVRLVATRDEETVSFENDLRRCRWTLLTACIGLVLGALAMAAAFTVLLVNV